MIERRGPSLRLRLANCRLSKAELEEGVRIDAAPEALARVRSSRMPR
ncbi:MAG: hypothetical protein OXC11_16105 [Rhodospirillales bacterium]|nr:hypothetical protein [Rhodospirillales bacterium]